MLEKLINENLRLHAKVKTLERLLAAVLGVAAGIVLITYIC